jgi:hypothetical protein
MRSLLPLLGVFCSLIAGPALALDLLERYPTSLMAGDTAPERAREWEFAAADIFHLSQFRFEVGQDFKIETGPADLGIGHSKDGAVWAVVLPRTEGTLVHAATNRESIAHVWLRFHPRELNRLFPADTVFADGATNQAAQIRAIANTKLSSSFHAGARAMIPEPEDLTVDADTAGGSRRFFMVDTSVQTAKYVAAFEKRAVKPPPAITPELAAEAFDQLWKAFDREYAMFVLRPELDWARSREQFRPRALASQSAYELADVCAEMLRSLRDLHVWMTVGGANVPVFNRPRAGNANPVAHRDLLGKLHNQGRVYWAVTPDKIGFLAIYGWNTGPEIPAQCDEALEAMRDTRGLIVDVRLNGGGDEPTAGKVAGRFLASEFVYAYSQYRNGPSHTNLTEKFPRKIQPRGPWRYDRPVVLLIGEKCMSSNESFIGMMTGATNVTTMGDHTCGSSGNPKMLNLPLGITVSLPRWIDGLPDGTPLDERGFQPQVKFEPKPGAFEGERDDLLVAALERLRPLPLPAKPIEGPAYVRDESAEVLAPGRRTPSLSDYAAAMKEEATDASRPRIVSVFPTNEAVAVASVTELRVRFDRPMSPWSLKLDWDAGGFTDFVFPKYDPERYEFVIPMRLVPGTEHLVVANKATFAGPGEKISEQRKQWPLDGFLSAENKLAGFFAWRFRTQALTSTNAKPARATRITPAPGSEVPVLTFVEIEFDRPMSPPTDGWPYVAGTFEPEKPQMISHVEHDPARRTFRLPLLSAPKKKAQFTLAGFRSADGTPVEPIKLNYQVTGEERAAAEVARTKAGSENPDLLALLDTMRQKRAQLTSLAERVQSLSLSRDAGAFTRLESKSASFRWQQPDQFYGDASQEMLSCAGFRIGSDGENWWWHYAGQNRTKLVVCPVKDMQTRNVSLCDPFDLLHRAPGKAASELGLRLLGRNTGGKTDARLLEAWDLSVQDGGFVWGQFNQWLIDPESLRPEEVMLAHPGGVIRRRFHYDTVNKPMPAEVFAVPGLPGVTPSPPEALDADYTNRFINLRDGSDGRMSVRWGKQGPKGTSSSGLN